MKRIILTLFTSLSLSGPISGLVTDVIADYRSFYSVERLETLSRFVLVSGLSANTGFDSTIRRKWQSEIQNATTKEIARLMCLVREEGIYFIPVYLGLSMAGRMGQPSKLTQWGDVTLRGMVVAYPEFQALSWTIGSSRPFEGHPHWKPFAREHGVSGHAFFGGLPLLAAAKVSENYLVKGAWYAASTLPGLARIDKDKHYFAQVLMGWGLAYMSVHHKNLQNVQFEVDGTYIGGKILL